MVITIKVLNTGIKRSEQMVKIQMTLLLKKQSDQDLHRLPFNLHLLDTLMHQQIKFLNF